MTNIIKNLTYFQREMADSSTIVLFDVDGTLTVPRKVCEQAPRTCAQPL